jgi:hypothetical protein
VQNVKKEHKEEQPILTHFDFPDCFALIYRQLDEARSTLQFMPNKELQEEMARQINDLDEECKRVCEEIPGGEFELG